MPKPTFYEKYGRARYKKAVESGMCPQHIHEPAAPGRTKCVRCLKYYRDLKKRYYDERKIQGVCPHHPAVPAVAGTFFCAKCLFRSHLRNTRRRGLSSELTAEHYAWLVSKPCAYCGGVASGVDRVKNEYGYTLLNSVPCCPTCNFLKMKLAVKAFVVAVNASAKHSPDYETFKKRWVSIRRKLERMRT